MKPAKLKAGVGITLMILFIITVASGICLHVNGHGVLMESHAVIKALHWIAGFLMVAFTIWHSNQFWKMLSALKVRYRWFWCDTWAIIIFASLTFVTGLVKLLSPVRIPHLGLWHYGLGIAMSVFIAVHMIRAIPSYRRFSRI